MIDTADLFQANTRRRDRHDPRELRRALCTSDRWQVVNLGLRRPRERRAPPEATRRDGHRRVFFVGRFESRKGIDTLLAAMERILPDYPDVELILAGEDRPLLPGRAARSAPRGWPSTADEPWIDRVTMLGVVDDETLHREYARADLVVLPSRYESFGLVMVEAMMHGKPLVSTDTSGVREVVRDGVDGCSSTPGDVDELEQAIRRMLGRSRADAADARRASGAPALRVAYLSSTPLAERFEASAATSRPATAVADDARARSDARRAGEASTIDLTGLRGRPR